MRFPTFFLLPVLLLGLFACANQGQPEATPEPAAPNYDSIRVVLEEMYDTDQGIRKQLSEQNTMVGELISKMIITDSINQLRIDSLLNTYGWLPESLIGKKASNAIFYVVQHAELPMMERWFPAFKKVVAEQEGEPRKLAMMEDRILMYRHEKQLYGTQIHGQAVGEEGWEYFVWPIDNPAEVNERRTALGYTQTVEEYAAEMDARYDPEEPLPKPQE